MVRLSIITDPVPPGSRRISAFESDEIMLSAKFKLSTPSVPVMLIAPVTVKAPSVDNPLTFNVPVVVRFEGNNASVGAETLQASDVDIIAATSLTDAVQQAVKAAGGAA